jgi:hypothetical protein
VKIKVKVYVNQHESVSHIQIRHAYDFSLCFLHELLMSFLIVLTSFLIVLTVLGSIINSVINCESFQVITLEVTTLDFVSKNIEKSAN